MDRIHGQSGTGLVPGVATDDSPSRGGMSNNKLRRLTIISTDWWPLYLLASSRASMQRIKRNELMKSSPSEGQGIQLNIRPKAKTKSVLARMDSMSGFNGSLRVNWKLHHQSPPRPPRRSSDRTLNSTRAGQPWKTTTLGKEWELHSGTLTGPVTLIDGLKAKRTNSQRRRGRVNQKDVDFETALDANEAIDTIWNFILPQPIAVRIYAPMRAVWASWAGWPVRSISIKTQETLKGSVEACTCYSRLHRNIGFED